MNHQQYTVQSNQTPKTKYVTPKVEILRRNICPTFGDFFHLPAVRSDLHRLQSPPTQKKLNPEEAMGEPAAKKAYLMVQSDIWRSWCTIFGCWQLCCCLKCDATNILTTRWWFSTCPPSNVLIFNCSLWWIWWTFQSVQQTPIWRVALFFIDEKSLALASKARTAARTFLFSSESVNEGHPDKLCDQVGAKRKGKLDGIVRSNRYFEL